MANYWTIQFRSHVAAMALILLISWTVREHARRIIPLAARCRTYELSTTTSGRASATDEWRNEIDIAATRLMSWQPDVACSTRT
jgi:hypothetical protein